MDSFGIGYSLDAYKFGDKGADTLGNIVKYRNSKNMILNLPNLAKRGLQIAAEDSRGSKFSRNIFSGSSVKIEGKYGYCVEQSIGKDTLTGHWEIAGVIAKFNWYYFTKKNNTGSYQKFIDLMDNILLLTEEIKKDFSKEFSQEYKFENSLKITLEK